MKKHRVVKIISGGQTGADQGALRAAIRIGLEHGGFCPLGRRCEGGRIPAEYHKLDEMETPEYQPCISSNVDAADGTLSLYGHDMGKALALAGFIARTKGKPQHSENIADRRGWLEASQRVRAWLVENDIEILNVAGTRESCDEETVAAFLVLVLQ